MQQTLHHRFALLALAVLISALIAMNRPDQLRSHMARARANGVTQQELVEAITHLAFYSGWPNAVTAVGVAREVFQAEAQPAASPGLPTEAETRP
jgi:alkylhydroperoxidase/carboxymuconolactone decarboxylase family protein YurZ